jgi:hypothetical protein
MAPPSFFLASSVESWAAFYGAHRMVSVLVRYLHLAGLVVGGGTALATDRQILNAVRSGYAQRSVSLAALEASHRVVVPALGLVLFTGVLMTAADLETFLASRLFWWKMALVGLLFVNGLGILAAERISKGGGRGWPWLGRTSAMSLLLWLVILFMGIWLTVAA